MKKMNRRHFILGSLSVLSSLLTVTTAIKLGNGVNKTRYISDQIFLKHHIAVGHPESPARISVVNQAITDSKLWQRLIALASQSDIDAWLKTIHTDFHIASIKHNAPLAHIVASAVVRACLTRIDQIANKNINNAFCATHPPGHHVLNTGKEEGFCYYNSIAIAARYAQRVYGFKKY